jgi:dimethylargininase
MLTALVRPVSPAIAQGERTHIEREPIDFERAVAQHDAYEGELRALGCSVVPLDPLPEMPDSVFVEDTVIALDEVAIITRPGAQSRRDETESMARAMRRFRELHFITEPAVIDGGDVLRIDRDIYVGRSQRTSDDAITQLRQIAAPLGYKVHAVEMKGALHLKTAVTRVGQQLLLCNPDWIVDLSLFDGLDRIDVDPAEPFAANALLIGETVLFPAAYPRTAERLEKRGVKLRKVDVSELAKAEGGLTCCSVLLEARQKR